MGSCRTPFLRVESPVAVGVELLRERNVPLSAAASAETSAGLTSRRRQVAHARAGGRQIDGLGRRPIWRRSSDLGQGGR
jgi:hypothetical protein